MRLLGARLARLASWCGALVFVGLGACSNEGPSTISSGGPASGSSSGTPAGQPRSYRKDVLPILTGSCALSQCHGDRTGNPGVGIYLPLGDPDGIHKDLLGESRTAKGKKFVVPRDAANSFLYGKIAGDLTNFIPSCPNAGCGEVMPPGTRLTPADLETVKLWINEGAANN
ncbi:MAG TPA: hypothetical protein VLT33_25015 [Labilithrix sp.]|nr:hypothetical protein [Labilithrix sp.]